MTCKNCNFIIPDGSMICDNCGAEVDVDNEEQTMNMQDSTKNTDDNEQDADAADVTNVFFGETPCEVPSGRKIPSKKIAAIIAALLAVAVAVVAFVFVSESDIEQYRKIEMSSIDHGIDVVANIADAVMSMNDGSAEMQLTLSDESVELLDGFVDIDLSDILGDVRTATIDIDHSMNNDVWGTKMSATLEDTEIISYEYIVDTKNGDTYVSYPGIYDEYIKSPKADNDTVGFWSVAGLLGDSKEFFDSNKVRPYAKKLVGTALNQVKDVKKSKTTVKVGNINQKAYVYTIKFDKKLVENVLGAVVKEAKNNSELAKIVYEYLTIISKYAPIELPSEDVFRKNYKDELQKAIDNLNINDNDVKCTYKLYTDYDDGVIGREFIKDSFVFKYISAKKGDKYAFDCFAEDENIRVFAFATEGKLKSGKYTGKANVSFDGEKYISLDFKDCKIDDKNMSSDGSVVLSLESGFDDILDNTGNKYIVAALKALKFEVNYSVSKTKSLISLGVKIGNTNYAELDVKTNTDTDYKPVLPRDYSSDGQIERMQFTVGMEVIGRLSRAGVDIKGLIMNGFGEDNIGGDF